MHIKKSIATYDFEKDAVDAVIQFEKTVNDEKIFKTLLGQFTLDIIGKLKNNKISDKTADRAYLLLDLFLTDNAPEFRNDSTVSQLLFEGNILHDLGKPYGADLKLMEDLSKKLLKNNE